MFSSAILAVVMSTNVVFGFFFLKSWLSFTAVRRRMEEVKRLQQEFAAAQASGSASKLSERNCIQILMKLQELGKLDLLYTMDGKTYLTHEQLAKEITDEVYMHSGKSHAELIFWCMALESSFK